MSSGNDSSSSTPQWFVYFVTITLGIAFTVTLVSIAWNNALKEAERGFALGSQLIKESVGRNARVANNTVNSVAAFFAANPDLSQHQFSIITQSLFAEHAFMQGAVYCRFEQSGTGAGAGHILNMASEFKLHQVAMRGGYKVNSCSDIFRSKGGYVAMLQELFSSKNVETVAAPKNKNENDYWLLKAVRSGGRNGSILGFVATLIDTRTLLGSDPGDTSLSIILVSDTASLRGRQLLFQKAEGGNKEWPVSELKEETVTQFPSYSIKLDIGKHIPLADVDKELIYNALLIGIGITLLIGALVRAKDVQERQLRERNVLIEKKVEEQTKELARARDHALDASRVKSDFLASMSHEIRTPLNAIIGMAELLGETPLSVEQKKYTNIFKKAGDTLLGLVNDILDLSKIEARQLVLEEIDFDLAETLEESIEIYALKAAEKNVELLCDIDSEVNCRRRGDPARLRQIVLNLISNALKFTDSGEIVVSVTNEQGASDADTLRISVRDTGIGIPPAKAESIFNSFTQVDSSTTRKYGGTGLGLTICRSLVEMMHGRIWVESEENRGSRFIFTLRLPPSEREPTIVPRPVSLSQKHILIVDDNASARNLLSTRLEAAGAGVMAADSGQEAIRLFKESGPFDLVLTDYRMPEMDGLELAKDIKGLDPNHPVLLMTDSAHLNQSLSDVAQHGIDGYVVKPVKHLELLKQISYSLNRKGGEPSEVESAAPAISEKSLRILLVDDNSDNRMLVKAYLKKFPYEVDEAENGKQALESFQDADYDLVLMDVQMPVMDGRNATRKIRTWETQEGRSRTPIVALTAHAVKEEIDECLQAGCDAHLSKPVKRTKLIETIQEYTQ